MREMSVKINRFIDIDHSNAERPHEPAKEKSGACPGFTGAIAEFTLRAGGRLTTATLHAHGGFYSHTELCPSEHLSREQWMWLCDNIQVIAHSMILLDYPDDDG